MSISELFLDELNVDSTDLQKALQFQQRNGGRLERILQNMGALSSELVPNYFSKLLNIPVLTLQDAKKLNIEDDVILKAVASGLPERGIYPLEYNNQNAVKVCAMIDPLDVEANNWLSMEPSVATIYVLTEDTQNHLKELFNKNIATTDTSNDLTDLEEDRLRELASEAPTVNLLNSLIAKALRQGASDMHVEPSGMRGRVRYRIDGVLHEAETIPRALFLPVITRLKILSNMDIAEKRRPQDGKIETKVDGKNIDIRVSALPVGGGGESIVMRFLLQEALNYDISKLGIEPDVEKLLLEDIASTSGVVLMTGPTGSGKTTSLYSFLSKRNSDDVKIITLEDPVEYQLAGINQVAVNAEIGYDFARALRSVVRQDPDIIMVGEIRDKETANISMQAALTGHLVFSTLHTNDAPTAYTRLLDLGVEEFLINSAVKSIIAQRLVRQLCPSCKTPVADQDVLLKKYNLYELAKQQGITANVHQQNGCEKCNHTGFRGRLAIIEYMKCDEQIQALPKGEHFLEDARKINKERGYRDLMNDGMVKVLKGQTTLAEVLRVAG